MAQLGNVRTAIAGAKKFLVGVWDNNNSFEVGILAANVGALQDGTLLGKITSSGQVTPLNPSASDGSQNCMGILVRDRRASAATQKVVYVARGSSLGEVNANLLVAAITLSAPQLAAALAALNALGIVTRY